MLNTCLCVLLPFVISISVFSLLSSAFPSAIIVPGFLAFGIISVSISINIYFANSRDNGKSVSKSRKL